MVKRLMWIMWIIMVLIVFGTGVAAAAPVQVTGMRWSVMPDKDNAKVTRLVLDLDGPYDTGRLFKRTLATQLALGGVFKNLVLGENANDFCNMNNNDVAASAKIAQDGGDLKLQVNLPAKSDSSSLNVFVLKEDKKNNKPWRIVIDIIKPLPQSMLEPASQTRLTPADYGTVQVTGLRWSVLPDVNGMKKVRVVFDLSGPYRLNNEISQTRKAPFQLQTVFNKMQLTDKVRRSVVFNDTVAHRMDLLDAGNNSVQLSVQLYKQLQEGCYNLFVLKEDPVNRKPWRIVMDITKPVPLSSIKFSAGLKGKKICIDPGHGGSDPGAVGPQGTHEADVTLPVSLQLKSILERAGCTVYMTRTDDRDVYGANADAADELQARVDVGNNNKADVFVCIHADSFSDPAVGGTGTYYFPKTNLDGLLAASVQEAVVRQIGLDNRGVSRANFYVLKYTTMPAILIEMAFISNPDEEKKLADAEFQKKAALGIAQGLDDFFSDAAKIAN